MKKVSSAVFWQTTFVLTFLINLAILVWSITRWVELKVVMWRSVWAIPLAMYLAALAGCVWLFLWVRRGNAERLLDLLELKRLSGAGWRMAGAAVFCAILGLIPWLKFSFHIGEVVKKSTQDPVLTTIVFYWLVWWLVLLAAGALKLVFKTGWAGGFATALVLLGLAYETFQRLHLVSTYPFSMGWSESSRYYYASLFFADRLYGFTTPLSSLHPSRYLLQSLPFFIPGLGLTASRLWQFLLWMGLTAITAAVLARRAFPAAEYGRFSGLRALFAGWSFLYLLRVGVYYHLEVMLFVPLLFVSARRPWRSLAIVALTSAWAGISRVNWFPVPAMLAIALYLLEEPLPAKEGLRRYLAWPAAWGALGLASALAAQALYIPLSGNAGNTQAFVSSFFSQLLWYRLWPNDSYPLGILPAILIVSAPLLLVIAAAWRGARGRLHPVRWLGLVSMLALLFAGGLVVSVKIGGGGDLHNMDAFAALALVTAAFFAGGRTVPETTSAPDTSRLTAIPWTVTAVALLTPLLFLIPLLSPLPHWNEDGNRRALEQLRQLALEAGKHGPVLFINERHLITFGTIRLPLVPDYEAVSLMESAMSNNQAVLAQFRADLKAQRFAAIVAGKQNVGIKEEGAFAEENNTWNLQVSPYLMCYYEPLPIASGPDTLTYIEADKSRIEFYLPRATPGVCP